MRLVPGLRLDERRRFGGYGGLLAPTRFADESGRLYAGEAAGLQDAEWGFGMMTAMRSGVLAANSILDGQDYATRASCEFAGSRDAGLVNRAMWDKLPQRLLDRALRFEAGKARPAGSTPDALGAKPGQVIAGPTPARRLCRPAPRYR